MLAFSSTINYCMNSLINNVESSLSELRLPDIPFYPTCRVVKKLFYVYKLSFYKNGILSTYNPACYGMNYTPHHTHVSTFLIVYVCVFTLFVVCSYGGTSYWFSVSIEVSNLPIPNGKGKNAVVSMVQKCEALQTLDNVETTQKIGRKMWRWWCYCWWLEEDKVNEIEKWYLSSGTVESPETQFGSPIWIGSWEKGTSRTGDWRFRMSWKRPEFSNNDRIANLRSWLTVHRKT